MEVSPSPPRVSTVVPNKQIWSEFILRALAHRPNFLDFGIVSIDLSPAFSPGGDTRMRIPYLKDLETVLVSDQRIAPADDFQLQVKSVDGNTEFGAILHRGDAFKDKWLEQRRTDIVVLQRYAPQIAQYNAIQIQNAFISILKGCFASGGVLATSHTTGSIATPQVLDVDQVVDAKAAHDGDDTTAGDSLKFLFVHSKTHADLVKRAKVSQASVGDIGAKAFNNGVVDMIGDAIIVKNSRMCKPFENGSGTTVYPSYLFSSGAFYLGYQKQMEIDMEQQLLYNGKRWILQWLLSYVPHLKGVNWNTVLDNPDLSDLETPANWQKIARDHEIGVRRIITKLA